MSLNRGKPSGLDLRWQKQQAKKRNDGQNSSRYKQWLELEISKRMEYEFTRVLRQQEEEDKPVRHITGIDFAGGDDHAVMVVARRMAKALPEVVFLLQDPPLDVETLLKKLEEVMHAEIPITNGRK